LEGGLNGYFLGEASYELDLELPAFLQGTACGTDLPVKAESVVSYLRELEDLLPVRLLQADDPSRHLDSTAPRSRRPCRGIGDLNGQIMPDLLLYLLRRQGRSEGTVVVGGDAAQKHHVAGLGRFEPPDALLK
jgi:hypothetical protein